MAPLADPFVRSAPFNPSCGTCSTSTASYTLRERSPESEVLELTHGSSCFLEHAYGSPVFLQVKRAETSVLEWFGSKGAFSNHGQRIVWGQRLTQAADDIFLGWEREVTEGQENDYYVRQLPGLAGIGGRRRHDACSNGALGPDVRLDPCTRPREVRGPDRDRLLSRQVRLFRTCPVKFAKSYADQNERDYEHCESGSAREGFRPSRSLTASSAGGVSG